jgi:DNA (cytosine-5)-methyltransferase 1
VVTIHAWTDHFKIPLKRQSPLTITSLFSGVGGLELGLSRAGHKTLLFCETDPAARSVLKSKFPRVKLAGDIAKLKTIPRSTNLVAMGFPCQDLSQAGNTQGVFGKSSGLVWKAFDLIEKRRVPWVLIENVPFMLRLDRGRAMAAITSRLSALGYKWAYRVVDARAFGVPQRRPRVYLLASLVGDPASVLLDNESENSQMSARSTVAAIGFYWTEGNRGLGAVAECVPPLKCGSTVNIPCPPAIVMADNRVITPHINDAERLQGLPVSWTAPARHIAAGRCRWRLVGNAVNVRVATWLGRRLRKSRPYDGSGDIIFNPAEPWPNAAYCNGEQIYISLAGQRPLSRRAVLLSDFLRFPAKPLSLRATRGIVSRLKRSNLRMPLFLFAGLEGHLARLEKIALRSAKGTSRKSGLRR